MVANRLYLPAGRTLAGVVLGLSLLSALSAAALAQAPAPLTHIPGSPFYFPLGGYKSVTLALSPDERTLFLPNSTSGSITSLSVAPETDPGPGALTMLGWSPTRPEVLPGGIATNPAGTKVYVTSGADTVNVHDIQSDGLLEQVQEVSLQAYAHPRNGIVYLSPERPGFSHLSGDFVYVNYGTGPYSSDKDQNYVGTFRVLADGKLELVGLTPTGGRVDYALLYGPVTLRAAGGRLFVSNTQMSYDPFYISNDITVFDVLADGSLVPVPGSPFALPMDAWGNPVYGSGGLAVDPAGQHLYAGTWNGSIVRFAIGADGALLSPEVFPTGRYDGVGAIEVDPTGTDLVAVAGDLVVMDLATMTPLWPTIPRPPYASGFGALAFNRAGTRLFCGTVYYHGWASMGTMVSVFRWGGTQIIDPGPLSATCGVPLNAPFTVCDPEGRALTASWIKDGQVVRTEDIPAGAGPTWTQLTYTDTYDLNSRALTLTVCEPGSVVPEASATCRVFVDPGGPASLSATVGVPVIWSPSLDVVNVGLNIQTQTCGAATKDYRGLPPDGTLQSVQGLGTYQMGPYTGLNAVMIGPNTEPIEIPVPPKPYDKLGFVVSASNAVNPEFAARVNVTIHYSEGDPDILTEKLIAPDWFIRYRTTTSGAPDPKIPDILNGLDLAYQDISQSSWHPQHYELLSISECVLRPDPTRTVTSVTVGGGYFQISITEAGIFALNGREAGTGQTVSVDLAPVFNRDVIFQGPDLLGDPNGFFNPGYDPYGDSRGNSFLVSGAFPTVVLLDTLVYSDEDDTLPTGGQFWCPDALDVGNGTLRLRAERNPKSDGRVYLITFRARDALTNTTIQGCATVTVPLRPNKAALDAVTAQARKAEDAYRMTGVPPPEYVVIGDGPVVGPKQ